MPKDRTKTYAEDVGEITDIRQSPDYGRFMESIGWEEVVIGATRAFVRSLPILGSVVRIPRANLPLPVEEIDQLARQRRAAVVKIEPNLLLEKLSPQSIGKFEKDDYPILPTKTIWVDLKEPLEKLWTNLEKDTRNLVRRAEKEGVRVAESRDVASFYKLWSDTARKKDFYVPFEREMESLWKSFGQKYLLVAKYEDKIVAAVMILGYKEAAYYYFAASNETGRSVYAAYLLLWEVIRKSKAEGYVRLDLEGIADERVRRTRDWAGFSHFKKGFGGKEVQYAGSFSKYYSMLGRIVGKWI